MPEIKQPVIVRAQIRRVCCGIPASGTSLKANRALAHWELYLVVYNTTEEWPAHKWPAARRHQVPTPAERTQALAELGYAPAPGAEWQWQETESTDHGHAMEVSFLGSISIVPLDQAQAVEGGER